MTDTLWGIPVVVDPNMKTEPMELGPPLLSPLLPPPPWCDPAEWIERLHAHAAQAHEYLEQSAVNEHGTPNQPPTP
jgi:hypothetical protein